MTTNLVKPISVPDLSAVKHFHLMAVGGAGMSPIAHLLRARGIRVDGCDNAESETAAALRADGIPVAIGHDPAHLAGIDALVVSSAIRGTNPELQAAKAAGLPVWHRSAALAALMEGHLGVAITGTHGKSTTSAMVATSLTSLDPSYVVGAVINATGAAYRAGHGLFVIEADESDGSFLQYRPQVVVVTNIEVDHLDRWGTPKAYADGFAKLALGPSVQRVVLGADDPGTVALAKRLRGQAILFGEAANADIRVSDISLQGLGSTATIAWPGGTGQLRLRVPGHHNVLDAAAAVATAFALRDRGTAVDIDEVIANLAQFTGTGRRFQIVGQTRGITVVDDYGHHPTEVAATLTAARAAIGPEHRLVACFQPHLYTRTRDFADAFGQALALADLVCVTDVYAAREDPIPGVTGRLVADAAIAHDAITKYVPTLDEAVSTLVDLVQGSVLESGDLIVTLGAGDVTTVGPRLLAALAEGANDDR